MIIMYCESSCYYISFVHVNKYPVRKVYQISFNVPGHNIIMKVTHSLSSSMQVVSNVILFRNTYIV